MHLHSRHGCRCRGAELSHPLQPAGALGLRVMDGRTDQQRWCSALVFSARYIGSHESTAPSIRPLQLSEADGERDEGDRGRGCAEEPCPCTHAAGDIDRRAGSTKLVAASPLAWRATRTPCPILACSPSVPSSQVLRLSASCGRGRMDSRNSISDAADSVSPGQVAPKTHARINACMYVGQAARLACMSTVLLQVYNDDV